ncbi:MAG: protein kinase [Acidobacteriota bacterium]|nr:protein kinase [Acidobacteriota bacterium]
MRFSPGTRLGPYELIGLLGAGGMGEVYRARDPRLNRDVAVKVLPSEVSSDSGRLRRFEQEARAAGALNHPNVLAVYDIGSHEGVPYAVSELLEGETLRDRLAEGALTPRKAVDFAVQIAHGLAAAHEKGIVHRDLKPENLFVTKEGRVKILDFGLAKLLEPESVGSQAGTGTAKNEILGTVGYMSPEQVKGLAVDHRGDIFAFGAVLYEMLSKRRAFQKETGAETLAAILTEDPPDLSAGDPGIPTSLSRIVRRCLEKRPEERFQSARDLGFGLEAYSGTSDGAPRIALAAPTRTPPARRSWWIPGAITAGLLLLGSVGWQLRQRDYFWKDPLAGARFSRFTDWEGSELDASISADGKFVAFLADRDGPFDAWVSQVGSGEFLNLTKGRYPSLANPIVHGVGFSGEGAHVWFRTNSKDGRVHSVLLVPTMGGAPRPFLPNAVEAAWSPDHNRILYYTPDPGDPIFIADRNGGNPRQVCVEKPGVHQHYVTWSPDGRFVYFVRGIPPDEMDIWRIASAGGVAERLTHHNSRVAYPILLDERTLIYTAMREDGSGSGLYAMDVERRIPHAVSAGLEEYVSVGASATARRLVATVANPVRDLWRVPITDHVVDESAVSHFKLPTVRAAAPRFGAGYLLYLGSKGAADGLWKLKDGSEVELWKGSEGVVANAPAVSPDGTEICFVVRSEGRGRLYLMAVDGTNVRRVAESLEVRGAPSWSPDGKWLAVAATEGKANPLFKVPVGGGTPVPLVDGVNSVISNPVWSPDGRFILYSEGQGSATVRLQGVTPDKRAFPLPEIWVGNTGDRYRFLPDGKSLVVTQGVLWLQNFSLLDLATGQQRQLTNLSKQIVMRSFDVSPDGKEIVFDRYRQSSDIVLIDRVRR